MPNKSHGKKALRAGSRAKRACRSTLGLLLAAVVGLRIERQHESPPTIRNATPPPNAAATGSFPRDPPPQVACEYEHE
ncbi:hypothetical protein F4809DRAFT_646881 [Biscogniauxia mediterranea]|nr:hypothetical protein F4809DRAFT_646881 [Biscogniauxia mediterranea]